MIANAVKLLASRGSRVTASMHAVPHIPQKANLKARQTALCAMLAHKIFECEVQMRYVGALDGFIRFYFLGAGRPLCILSASWHQIRDVSGADASHKVLSAVVFAGRSAKAARTSALLFSSTWKQASSAIARI